jgi:hypothetical protein
VTGVKICLLKEKHTTLLNKEVRMTSIADSSVTIQTTPEPNFSTPSWFGEVVVISSYLRKHGVLSKINEQVRFTRKRFGRYDVIDFLAVLFGCAISGERTDGGSSTRGFSPLPSLSWPCLSVIDCLLVQPSRAFWQRSPRLQSKRCARSFLMICSRVPLRETAQTGGLVDRKGDNWMVFDIDGTREAARQRALPEARQLASFVSPIG